MQILLATNNPGKRLEIEALLAFWGARSPHRAAWEVILPSQLGLVLEVAEDGRTYAENASLKAMAYRSRLAASAAHSEAAAGGAPLPPVILADDSGLEVAALDGAPGLHSARYAGQAGAGRPGDAQRRAFLLQNLAGKPRPWAARFVCTVALVSPSGELVFSEGECRGEIIPDERGSNGFGYDPIFLLPELGLTMAELTTAEKNRLSHRALAVRSAIPYLESWASATEQ